jgi:hypothetical protein
MTALMFALSWGGCIVAIALGWQIGLAALVAGVVLVAMLKSAWRDPDLASAESSSVGATATIDPVLAEQAEARGVSAALLTAEQRVLDRLAAQSAGESPQLQEL